MCYLFTTISRLFNFVLVVAHYLTNSIRLSCKQKRLQTYYIPNFPDNVLTSINLSSLIEAGVNFSSGNQFFWTNLTLRRLPSLLLPRGKQDVLHISVLQILHPYKQTTEYMSKTAPH